MEIKLSKFARDILQERYLRPWDNGDVNNIFVRAVTAFSDDEKHASRMLKYVQNKWFCPSTPILANSPVRKDFGRNFHDNFDENLFDRKTITRNMPISCFLSYVGDSVKELIDHCSEVSYLSTIGGGCAGHWSDIRAFVVGGKSPGPIPFIKILDSAILAYHQSNTRRGSYAAYLDISHPSIEEFIVGRSPTGGDINRKFLNLHHGVNITDEFLECVKNDKEFNLVCKHTNKVIKSVNSRTLWFKILETRHKTGEPYLIHIDEANRCLNKFLKEKGLKINGSNLCSEILLPTNSERSAVCCLSSLNLEKFDEWCENEMIIEDCVRFLDNVLEYFIRFSEKYSYLDKTINSCTRERSIGLGTMGFHSFLQKNFVSVDSLVAKLYNKKMFELISRKAKEASMKLAEERGEPEDIKGSGMRNAHLIAVAPNATTSILFGTSPSIEPLRANCYIQKTISGINVVKNRFLIERMKELGVTGYKSEKLIRDIIKNKGSIRTFKDIFDKKTMEVFKTAIEINQNILIDLAADRQKYIDQGQSLNLFFPSETKISYLSNVHWNALYKKKLKTLYYLRSEPVENAKLDYEISESEDGDCKFCAD